MYCHNNHITIFFNKRLETLPFFEVYTKNRENIRVFEKKKKKKKATLGI